VSWARAVRSSSRFGWAVDLYLRVGEPMHAREVLGAGLADLVRAGGFVDLVQPARGAAPMQIVAARIGRAGRNRPAPGTSRVGDGGSGATSE
jgi:hypothetical protein